MIMYSIKKQKTMEHVDFVYDKETDLVVIDSGNDEYCLSAIEFMRIARLLKKDRNREMGMPLATCIIEDSK